MALKFPLYIDLEENNCTVFGGGKSAYSRILTLLHFKAKVTVISPDVCDEIRALDKNGRIRYIPRKYYRGDCSTSYLCVAATGDEAVNISISDECKAKSIPINVSKPEAFGTFKFPCTISHSDVIVSVHSDNDRHMDFVAENLDKIIPILLEKLEGGK